MVICSHRKVGKSVLESVASAYYTESIAQSHRPIATTAQGLIILINIKNIKNKRSSRFQFIGSVSARRFIVGFLNHIKDNDSKFQKADKHSDCISIAQAMNVCEACSDAMIAYQCNSRVKCMPIQQQTCQHSVDRRLREACRGVT